MKGTVPIITIFNVLADSSFNWKLKDASDNDLTSALAQTFNNNGGILIFKSDLNNNDINNIKALANAANLEAALKLELEYTDIPAASVT